jgi:hypothetical protein
MILARTIKYSSLFFLIILSSACHKAFIIPAQKDAWLSSSMRDSNISGKNQPVKGKGFGSRKRIKGGFITYPSMYIYSSNEENEKDSFIVGGFDLSGIKGEIVHASLKFYINYASVSRKNICIFVRPVNSFWDEDKIKFSDIYNDSNNILTDSIAEYDDKKCLLILFNINKNGSENFRELPSPGSYRTVSINVTKYVKEWALLKKNENGFLIDPLTNGDLRYRTTDHNNVISDFGVIEIASREWFGWDGKVPDFFYAEKEKWMDVKNNAEGKIKFIPRLEIFVK